MQVLTVGVVGVLGEVALLGGAGGVAPVAGAGDGGLVDQVVVLAEAHEYARQQPGHGHLGQAVLQPVLEAAPGPVGVEGGPPLPFETAPHILVGLHFHTQVGHQRAEVALEVAQQAGGIDHGVGP